MYKAILQRRKMRVKEVRKWKIRLWFIRFRALFYYGQHIALPFDSKHRRRNGESRSPRRLVILDEPSIVTFAVKWCGNDRSMRGEPRWWNARNYESAISILRPADWRYPYSSIRLNLKVSVTFDLPLKSTSGSIIFIRKNFSEILREFIRMRRYRPSNYLYVKNNKVICIIHLHDLWLFISRNKYL